MVFIAYKTDAPEFHGVGTPTVEPLQILLSQIIKRIMKVLVRHNVLI